MAAVPAALSGCSWRNEATIETVEEIVVTNRHHETRSVDVLVERGSETVVEETYELEGSDGNVVRGERIVAESLSTDGREVTISVRAADRERSVTTADLEGITDADSVRFRATIEHDDIVLWWT